jgi:hypothetical protein
MLSRIFIRRRELTQFIRKTGPDRTTSGAQNPERLRSADHTTRHFGGLDWDLNTHRSTQQLIGRIGISARSTQTTSKDRSSRIRTSTRISTTSFRCRHEPPYTTKNQDLSSPSPPLKGETTTYYFFFSPQKRKEEALPPGTTRSTSRRTSSSSLLSRKLNVTSGKGMTPGAPLKLSRESKGFPRFIPEARNNAA